jgi:hypothetical protein
VNGVGWGGRCRIHAVWIGIECARRGLCQALEVVGTVIVGEKHAKERGCSGIVIIVGIVFDN